MPASDCSIGVTIVTARPMSESTCAVETVAKLPVLSTITTRGPMSAVPASASLTWTTFEASIPGSSGITRTAPVASTTRSAVSGSSAPSSPTWRAVISTGPLDAAAASAAASTSRPSRMSTPSSRISCSSQRVESRKSRRVGAIASTLTAPPSSSARSNSVTWCPRRAAISAVFMPAGPPPMTATRAGVAAGSSVPAPKRASRPAAGLRMQVISWPSHSRSRQPWLQPMQRRMLSVRPACAFLTHSGSVMSARATPTRSASPRSRISLAISGVRIRP